MKIILKILFFLLTVFHTNIVEAKIIVFNGVVFVTKICVVNIESKKESKQISEIGLDLSYKSESDFVKYEGRAKGIEVVATKGVGKALSGVDDVLANPNLLQGKSLEQVQSVLGNSKNWVNDVMRKSTRADGWVLREMNQAGTDFTGRMIQYHPGTPRHFGGAPYWKVSSGNGTFRIPLNP